MTFRHNLIPFKVLKESIQDTLQENLHYFTFLTSASGKEDMTWSRDDEEVNLVFRVLE